MRHLKIVKMLALLFVAGWLPATAFADAAEEVRCSEIAFSTALENQDLAAFSALIDDEARFLGGKPRRGKDEVVAAWSHYFDEDATTKLVWRPKYIEVLDSGDLALSRGPVRITGIEDDGTAFEDWGMYNSIWRRNDDGEWRVIFDSGNSSPNGPSDDNRERIENAAPTCTD